MTGRFIQILIVIAIGFIAPTRYAIASASIFYQPQLSHMAIDENVWPSLFKQLHRNGIDTLVFQWTRHDNAFIEGEESTWLERRIQDALDAELNLILGLSADSDVFQRLAQPTTILPAYFRKIREKDRALVAKWAALLPPERLVGWYLPLEIDDKRWRQTTDQAALIKYIRQSTDDIHALQETKKPIYLSTFFTGQMSPLRYAEMTRLIQNTSGAKLWVQDGAGVRMLTTAERKLYLAELTDCRSPAISGIIYEIFTQVKDKTAESRFAAVPLARSARKIALAKRAPCLLETSFFGLNYLMPLAPAKNTTN